MNNIELASEILGVMSFLCGPGGLDPADWPAISELLRSELGYQYKDGRWRKTEYNRNDEVREVFEYWRTERERVLDLSGGPKMKLTGKRRSKINARLSEGYKPNHLKEAVDGMLQNEHNVANGYTDIELCLRDQGKVEMYRSYAQKTKKKGNTLYKVYEAV